ncbi:hypothetical protein JQ631_32150 [Bradyrhizobium manausense]|uniref:hypothetical protein n=1 Tax=Bradyrhizobium manausense TaxID=989370 RepID=UPI001BA49301|nr:hypothetical protein [Bradyrhizobium manausense]MBR0793758.1 hypothetical protein [Bradyrhizobium manausense]
MLKFAAVLAATATLAGCNSFDCGQQDVVESVKTIAKQTNNPLANSLLSEAIMSVKQPPIKDRSSEKRDLEAALDKARRDCKLNDAMCTYMSRARNSGELPNYPGTALQAGPREVDYYRQNFAPIREKLTSLEQEIKTAYVDQENQRQAGVADLLSKVSYNVEAIRLRARNDQTGAVACVANLSISTPNGSWWREIEYIAEKTSDGGTVVRVGRLGN